MRHRRDPSLVLLCESPAGLNSEFHDMQDDVIDIEQQSLLRRQTSNQKCVLCYQRWLTMAFTACGTIRSFALACLLVILSSCNQATMV